MRGQTVNMLILVSIFHLVTSIKRTKQQGHVTQRGLFRRARCSLWRKLSNYLKSVSSHSKQRLLCLPVSVDSDEFCTAVWVMFTDQSHSVKSGITALQNSAGLPWRIVALFTSSRKSNWGRSIFLSLIFLCGSRIFSVCKCFMYKVIEGTQTRPASLSLRARI